MQRKLNEQFFKEYSRQFSEKITSEFFAEKEHITGKEILSISPSRQVNFFVLKILFGNWQEEMKKLESPYFNYRDPEVRRAMVDFMNILSQKILIDEDHFYELMEEAVYDTLKLAVLPQKFLYDELIQKDINNVNEKVTRPLLKYIKLHKEYFETFFAENAGEELETFLDRSREFFEGVDARQTIEGELVQLAKIQQVTIEDLVKTEDNVSEEADDFESIDPDFSGMEDEEEDDHEEAVTFHEEPDLEEVQQDEPEDDSAPDHTESISSSGAADEDQLEENPDLETEGMASGAGAEAFGSELENTFGDDPERNLSEDVSVSAGYDEVANEELTAKEEEEIRESVEQAESAELKSDEEETDEDSLNKKFTAEQSTINDRYANEEKFTVADKLEKGKVNDIMEAISVNHRYMFTKELFAGDREEFNGAISKIEQCSSFDDAVEMLVQEYAKERSWDMNSEEVKELLKVVFRKFR